VASIEFEWSDEQRALRELVAGFFTRSPGDGYDRPVWRRLGTDLSALGLAASEAFGGSGASAIELGIVAEEMGRALYSAPFLATAGLAMTTLGGCARDQLVQELLPQLVDGTLVATAALSDVAGRIDLTRPPLTARRNGDRWALDGSSSFVLDGGAADVVVCYASAGDIPGIFVVRGDATGLARSEVPGLDPGRHQAHLTFHGAEATEVGSGGSARTAVEAGLNVASALLAAEQAGVARAMLATTLDYAKTRMQFGRPIGSFQAVKHRLADMYVDVEDARSTSYHALWAIAEGTDDPALAASLAYTVSAEAARRVTASAIQVHGGIGFTWEHPAHRYFKRAVSNGALLGGKAMHAQRLTAAALGEHALAGPA
jgi:alkylation response protein AidB-like acyl-CoA dehydrogenase